MFKKTILSIPYQEVLYLKPDLHSIERLNTKGDIYYDTDLMRSLGASKSYSLMLDQSPET